MDDELPDALIRTLAATAGPYGFTLTVWGSAALLADRHGLPGGPQIAGFVAGAVAAFALLLAAASCSRARAHEPEQAGAITWRARAGAANGLAAGAALTVASLAARLPRAEAWTATAFTATAAYLLGAAVAAAAVSPRPAARPWRLRRRPPARRRR